MKTRILGLTGLAGHGKTDVAKLLAEKSGFMKIALADPVKRAAAGIYGLPVEVFYEGGSQNPEFCRNTTVIAPYNLTIRQMMRGVGDAMKTQHGGDFWINITKCEIQRHLEADPNITGFIIEDIRYDKDNPWGPSGSEYDAIKSWGAKIIHVDAESRVGRTEVHNSHCSEKGVNRLEDDIVIDNNGDLETLPGIIEMIVSDLQLNTQPVTQENQND